MSSYIRKLTEGETYIRSRILKYERFILVLIVIVPTLIIFIGNLIDRNLFDFGFVNTSFGECLYYVLTTLTSVGYGDYSPRNTPAKALAIILFCFMLYLRIPYSSNGRDSILGDTV